MNYANSFIAAQVIEVLDQVYYDVLIGMTKTAQRRVLPPKTATQIRDLMNKFLKSSSKKPAVYTVLISAFQHFIQERRALNLTSFAVEDQIIAQIKTP